MKESCKTAKVIRPPSAARVLCEDETGMLGIEAAKAGHFTDRAPLRVLVIRSVSGRGGGAEKIILRTQRQSQVFGLNLTACIIHSSSDLECDFIERADRVGLRAISAPQRWPGDPSVLKKLVEIAESQECDVIHSHDYKANYYALKIAQRLNVPTVSTSHGWTGNLWRERYLYYPVDKRLLRRFNAVIGVSTEITDELVKRGVEPSRASTLLNGVEPTNYARNDAERSSIRRELGFDENDVVIGSVGRLEKQKRFDLLIDAFANLRSHRPKLQLVIVGAGSLLEELKAYAERRGVSHCCRILGHRSDVLSIYQGMDLYVQSSEYEGTPTVLLEAMAMQLPIVATDVGGTTELAEPDRHALIVPPHNSQQLEQAIESVLDDRISAAARAATARVRVENELSMRQRTSRLAAIYEGVIAEHQQR